MFDPEGRRITNLDQIMDGGTYICSSSKKLLPGNYGSFGDDFHVNNDPIPPPPRSPSPIRGGVQTNLFSRKSTVNSAPISSDSISDFLENRDREKSGNGIRAGSKPSSGDGKIIRIINADEQHIKERVLLNLKTSQPFEEVLRDLGLFHL